MKVVFLTYFFVCFSLCSFAQGDPKNDLAAQNLKGKVRWIASTKTSFRINDGAEQKLLTIDTISYNQYGNEVEHENYSPRGEVFIKTVKYDSKGTVIQKTGKLGSSGIMVTDNYANGVHTGTNMTGADGKIMEQQTYKNDEKGRMIGIAHSDKSGTILSKTSIKYNEKGEKIEEVEFKDEKVNRRDSFKYDNKGRLVEEDVSVNDYPVKTLYKYNLAGKVIEKKRFADGILKERLTMKYDDMGNDIEDDRYDGKDSLTDSYITTYENFDKQHNWLKRNEFTGGKISDITERKIEYY
jgi:hypothetical protein